jgi:hypothetical protein
MVNFEVSGAGFRWKYLTNSTNGGKKKNPTSFEFDLFRILSING